MIIPKQCFSSSLMETNDVFAPQTSILPFLLLPPLFPRGNSLPFPALWREEKNIHKPEFGKNLSLDFFEKAEQRRVD